MTPGEKFYIERRYRTALANTEAHAERNTEFNIIGQRMLAFAFIVGVLCLVN